MKKLLVQLLVFISPLFIFLSVPTYILWQSKENFYKIDKLVNSNEKYIIGYMYNENNYGYVKWAYLNSNKKKCVWALGFSRVLQFRMQMFDSSFYNAGYSISSIKDFTPFIRSTAGTKYPGYIIMGLDQWMFNSSWDALNSSPSVGSWQNSFTLYPKVASTYQTVYKDLFEGRYTPCSLQRDKSTLKIGLNATVNNTGFRNDGSMYYGVQIAKLINNDVTASDYNYSQTFDRIRKGSNRFEYGKTVNEKALLELDEILRYCKEHQIEVIAFLPPFADKVYNKMIETGKYLYLKEIYSKVKPFFDKYKYEVYDFSSVSLCNSSDYETIDGFHGSELTYERILINMLNSGSILNQVTNVERLKTDLSRNRNNYIIYNY